MDVQAQPILQFNRFEVISVNANLINPFNQEAKPNINLNINPRVFYPEGLPNEFNIIIDLKVEAVDFFIISIVAFGNFTLNKPVTDPDSKPFIDVNAPAIVFPYLRSFLSTLTANLGAGFPPIILPPQFFQGELIEYKPPVPAAKID